MLKRRSWLVITVVLVLGSAGIYTAVIAKHSPAAPERRPAPALKKFEDKQLGIKFSLPKAYEQRQDTPPPAQTKALPAKNFERLDPQGLLTVRYETGLSGPANLLKRNLIEYIEGEIRQFFALRYKDYESISLQRTTVGSRPAVEHVFRYSDQDGNPVQARLMAIPYDDDAAYYLILQAHAKRYQAVETDLDQVTKSLQLSKPSGP